MSSGESEMAIEVVEEEEMQAVPAAPTRSVSNAVAGLFTQSPKEDKKRKRKRVVAESTTSSEDEAVVISRRPPAKKKFVCKKASQDPTPTRKPRFRENWKRSGQMCGSLLAVHMKYFMCHKEVKITEFNPHVNFITGANGSGKSSVLSAVVIGLGGLAGTQGRGSAVREYIQSGQSSAVIRVTLSNDGRDPFKPEEYGTRITVERTIHIRGASQYKIMDANDKVVSVSTKELNAIKDCFNIMLDNPVFVVTQEASREFLQRYDPKRLYQFFCRSTKLNDLKTNIEQLQSEQSACEYKYKLIIKHLKMNEEEVEELREKERKHMALMNGKRELRKFAMQLQFIAYTGDKKDVDELVENIKVAKEELVRLDSRLDQCLKPILKDAKADYEKKKAELDTAAERVTVAEADLKQSKGKHNQAKADVDKVKREQGEKNEAIEREESKIAKLETLINQIEKASGSHSEKIGDLRQKVEAEQDKIADAKEKMKEANQKLEPLITQATDLNKRVNIARNACDEEKRQLSDKMKEKDRMSGMGKSDLNVYGRDFEQLQQLIEQHRNKFKTMPKGPLGKYIKLKDPKVGFAVEKCIGPHKLKSYICDNDDDDEILKKLIDRVFRGNYKPNHSASKFIGRAHDVSQYRPAIGEFPTVAELLDITDVDVFNALVDTSGIDSTIIFDNETNLRHYMRDAVPRNCNRTCYDLKGNSAQPAPQYVFYGNRQQQNTQLLGVSVEERVRGLDGDIASLKERVRGLEAQTRHADNEFKRAQAEQKNLTNRVNQAKGEGKQLERNVDKLNEQIAQLARDSNQTSDIHRTNQNDARNRIEKLEAELKEITDKLPEKEAEEQALGKEVKFKKNELKKITDLGSLEVDINKLMEDIAKAERKILQNSNQKTKWEKKLTEMEKDLGPLEAKVEAKLAQLQECLKEGETLEQFKTKEKKEKIEQDSDNLRLQLDTAVGELGDIDEIQTQLREKRIALKKAIRKARAVRNLNQLVASSIALREKMFSAIKKYMACVIRMSFQTNMALRQYKGDLDIDYENHQIKITADMKKVNIKMEASQRPLLSAKHRTSTAPGSSSSVTDLKGLSGGERSFTTVCFLISLWEHMDAPFRCMDEFDVFMDQVNRSQSLKMLLEFAKGTPTSPPKQFVMLTPLDTAGLKDLDEEFVTVFKMDPPKRKGGQIEA